MFVASRPPRRAANPVLPRSGGHGKGGRAESRADGSQTLRAAELNASREWASGIFQRAADNSENLKKLHQAAAGTWCDPWEVACRSLGHKGIRKGGCFQGLKVFTAAKRQVPSSMSSESPNIHGGRVSVVFQWRHVSTRMQEFDRELHRGRYASPGRGWKRISDQTQNDGSASCRSEQIRTAAWSCACPLRVAATLPRSRLAHLVGGL